MATIAAITEREVGLISRFVGLLKEEQEALKLGDASALPATGAAKTELVEQLNRLEDERRLALGSVGNENTREAMSRWLADHPAELTVASHWAELLRLASEAKELHQINAGLVAMHLEQTKEALSILTRQPPQHLLYGSDGQAAPSSGSNIIDSA